MPPEMPQEINPTKIRRAFEHTSRVLYIPFITVMCALAAFMLTKACVLLPYALEPIIEIMPDNVVKYLLIWVSDTSGTVGHYADKIFIWLEPYAKSAMTFLVNTAKAIADAFTTWVESL